MLKNSPLVLLLFSLGIFAVHSKTGVANAAEAPVPIAQYRLDGNAIDASGNNLHGVLLGPQPTVDRFGSNNGALLFNGVSDYIDLGNAPAFNFSNSFTLSAWVKVDNASIANAYVMGKYQTAGPFLNTSHSYGLGTDELMRPYAFVLGSGVYYTDVWGNRSLNDGKWHGLAVVYDENYGLKLFVDGGMVFWMPVPNLPPFTNSYPLLIGKIASGLHFKGSIDDVLIYDTPLTDAAIVQLHPTDGPPPASVFQNATATYSQGEWHGDFSVGRATDGTSDEYLGWAIYPEVGTQTAVFETRTDLGIVENTTLTFKMLFAHRSFGNSSHPLGKFRLSVTTDSRDTFADGLARGGDVTANWIVLAPTSVTSEIGATLTESSDHAILASGAIADRDVYTFKAIAPVSGITGVRLEALTDPSLPYGGPGREPDNGNFVLSEFTLEVETRFPPSISKQPESREVELGGSVSFDVVVNNTIPVAYQWFFNSSPIVNATNASLALEKVELSHAGTYMVEVRNAAGTKRSEPAILHVRTEVAAAAILMSNKEADFDVPITDALGTRLEGAAYLVQLYGGVPETGLVYVGAAIPFGVGTNAGYFFDSVPRFIPGVLPGETASLVLRVWESAAGPTYEKAVANGGQYGSSELLFVSTHGAGEPPARLIGLKPFSLVGPPVITAQPAELIAEFGSRAEFVVTAGGQSPLTYQWSRDGTEIVGAVSSNLIMTNVSFASSGNYAVEVRNGFGGVRSATARLQVLDRQAPAITITSPAPGATLEDQVTLAGKVVDNVGVARVEAEVNGKSVGPVTLGPGSFSMTNVALIRGENRLRVRAFDEAGNGAAAEIKVLLEASRKLFFPDIPPIQEGARLKVPIMLRSRGDVGAITFQISYPANYLAEPEVFWTQEDPSAFTQVNTNVAGQVRVSFALAGKTLAAGTNALASISFRVRSIPQNIDALIGLQLVGIYGANGDPIPTGADVSPGTVRLLKRKYVGDNNANDKLDVGDASILMRMVALLDPIRSWDIPANDLNNNSDIDAGDIIRVLRTVVELDPQPGALSALSVLTRQHVSSVVSGRVSATSDKTQIAPGETLRVKVKLDALTTSVLGVSFRLEYPASGLRLENSSSHRAGAMIPSNGVVLWNVSPENDYQRADGLVHMAASSAVPWPSSNGDIAEFLFVALPGVQPLSSLPLKIRNFEIWNGSELASLSPVEMSIGAAVPASISAPSFNAGFGTFRFTVSGKPGVAYRIEVSDDLKNWIALRTEILSAGSITIDDPEADQTTRRFYRAVQAE
jgi:hypothetical protein